MRRRPADVRPPPPVKVCGSKGPTIFSEPAASASTVTPSQQADREHRAPLAHTCETKRMRFPCEFRDHIKEAPLTYSGGTASYFPLPHFMYDVVSANELRESASIGCSAANGSPRITTAREWHAALSSSHAGQAPACTGCPGFTRSREPTGRT